MSDFCHWEFCNRLEQGHGFPFLDSIVQDRMQSTQQRHKKYRCSIFTFIDINHLSAACLEYNMEWESADLSKCQKTRFYIFWKEYEIPRYICLPTYPLVCKQKLFVAVKPPICLFSGDLKHSQQTTSENTVRIIPHNYI